MTFTRKQIFILAASAVSVVVLLFVLISSFQPSPQNAPVSFTLWTPFEEQAALAVGLAQFKRTHPNVTVSHQTVPLARYRETLLEALAAGRGPDIFYLHNRALPLEIEKVIPAPESKVSVGRLREFFPKVVEQDFSREGKVYALPLFLDTLALFYNRDLFDQAGLVGPPANWDEFVEVVGKLRALDERGQIVRAGAAIGGTEKTVRSAADLLVVLMLQNGAQMTDLALGRALFAAAGRGNPGLRAFNFYLQFASSASTAYTWNEAQLPSLEAFAQGKAGMVFGYFADLEATRKRSPFLDYGVSPLPQPKASDARVDYADYWGLAVSRQGKKPELAWELVDHLATNAQASAAYLKEAGRLPALRSMIAQNLERNTSAIFVKGALTARSWYEPDEHRVRAIFDRAISRVLTGQANSAVALGEAEAEISRLFSIPR